MLATLPKDCYNLLLAEMYDELHSVTLNTYDVPAGLTANCKIQPLQVTEKAPIDAVLQIAFLETWIETVDLQLTDRDVRPT